MSTMPSGNSRRRRTAISTPTPTHTDVSTDAGTFTVQAGTEQYETADHGWTAPRPVVAFWIRDQNKPVQIPAAQAETFGRALMFAAVDATNMAEEVAPNA